MNRVRIAEGIKHNNVKKFVGKKVITVLDSKLFMLSHPRYCVQYGSMFHRLPVVVQRKNNYLKLILYELYMPSFINKLSKYCTKRIPRRKDAYFLLVSELIYPFCLIIEDLSTNYSLKKNCHKSNKKLHVRTYCEPNRHSFSKIIHAKLKWLISTT